MLFTLNCYKIIKNVKLYEIVDNKSVPTRITGSTDKFIERRKIFGTTKLELS
jgi:hypothetical protein